MSPQSLQDCATAVEALVAERGTRAVGALIGHDKSTVARWGADLTAWPTAAVLALARESEGVRKAIVNGLSEHAGDDRAACIARDADALADELLSGALAIRDASARIPLIDAAMAKLRAIRADYAAVAKGSSVFGRRVA